MTSVHSETAAVQSRKFDALLGAVLRDNAFYRTKFGAAGFESARRPQLSDLASLPVTLKSELVEDQELNAPFGTNLTFPVAQYARLHQTSGTTGNPLRWLDTADSWQWWLDCWHDIYSAAGVTTADRIFLAFGFGPFIGFWSAFEGAQNFGAMVISGGSLSTEQRVQSILDTEATVLVCTPTYALRLAEVAKAQGHDLPGSAVHTTVHAGEPGASVPNVRAQIQSAWGITNVVDHVGATEMGAWGYTCGRDNHMHINEQEFVAEVVDPDTRIPVKADEEGIYRGEMVLTNLGRTGSPLIRYCTGDHVELSQAACPCGRNSAVLRGGVLGRVDQMLVIRGINVYPSALENLIRSFPEVEEFEVEVLHERNMAELLIRIELNNGDGETVAVALRDHVHQKLSLRPKVETVSKLPRYELKARRFKF